MMKNHAKGGQSATKGMGTDNHGTIGGHSATMRNSEAPVETAKVSNTPSGAMQQPKMASGGFGNS